MEKDAIVEHFLLRSHLGTNQARQVSERLPYNSEPTWSAEWCNFEIVSRYNFAHRGAWPEIGLGCPASCRPHLKQCGTTCGLSSAGHLSWKDLQLT
eukprot:211927-Amphidinium_carterae.1